jgi:uncharacterized membrane protein
MESRASFRGHPIQQMLIIFPLGLLATAVIFDVITLWSGYPIWTRMAFWLIAAGILSGLPAAIFGFIDWTRIPAGTQANVMGMCQGAGNIVIVGFFAASWILRRTAPDRPDTIAYVFSFLGAGVCIATAWLGGKLVNCIGAGVDSDQPAMRVNPRRA